MTVSAIHLYANAYGWTRDYILDHVYLDEHFIFQDKIEKEKKQKYLMLASIEMLPHLEKSNDRKQFFDMLSDKDTSGGRLIDRENVKTDFKAIKRAKEKLLKEQEERRKRYERDVKFLKNL